MSMKNPLTPAGIDPATFRFVSQQLNHRATVVPFYSVMEYNFLLQRGDEHNLQLFQAQGVNENIKA